MTGLAVGGVVVAAALSGLAIQAADSRRLLAAVRFDHDVQATAQLAARHLRRSGHWAHADAAVWHPDADPPAPNPHRVVADGPAQLAFSYDTGRAADAPSPGFGLRLHDRALQFRLGAAGWHGVHDAQAFAVATLSVEARTQTAPPGADGPPADTTLPCPPAAGRATLDLHLRAVAPVAMAPRPDAVPRDVHRHVVLRNDTATSACRE